jgi:hypothetical protein
MANDLSSALQDAFLDLLRPLQQAASDPALLAEWLATLGQTASVTGDPSLLGIVQKAQAVITKISGLDPATLQSWSGLAALLKDAQDIAGLLAALRAFANDPSRSQATAGMAEDIMSALLAGYLRRNHPKLFRVASLLTVIQPRETAPISSAVVQNDVTVRYARMLDQFNFATLSGLLSQPGQTLRQVYFPNALASGVDAWTAATRLFPVLSLLADDLGLPYQTAYQPTVALPPSTDPDPPEASEEPVDVDPDDPPPEPAPPLADSFYAGYDPTFTLPLFGTENNVALQIAASSLKHPGAVAGYTVSLTGNLNQSVTIGQWKLSLSSTGTVPAFAINASGVTPLAGSATTSASAKLQVEAVPPQGSTTPAVTLGDATGTHIEIGRLALAAELDFGTATSAALDLAASSGALIISPGDGDGFLSSILPSGGLKTTFDLGLTWSSATGLALHGGAGLSVAVPVGLSVAGITLSSLNLALNGQTSGLNAQASANLAASIGPVKAAVSGLGIAATLGFPAAGGNLGLADIGFSLQPPSGAGLSIDASGVLTGGGFLGHDAASGTYSGAMQLSLHDQLTLNGYGLIATKMPDGSSGFSMLVFITADGFEPVQLGFGFMLQGVGGMLGINRGFDQDVISAALKADTLKTLLMPQDPVGNAPAILQSLAGAFPAQQGSYLLGLLAHITWFEPTLVDIDLALILQLGTRNRLLALGRVSALLPTADNDLIRLILDADGELDFDEGTFSADAVLVDSRLVHKFPITGQAAMRGRWSGSGDTGPSFVLAVGGLNPHFTPPDGFPQLERVSIALCSGDNPRLICDAYLAVTANTVQFGSQVSLYAAALGFSVTGDLGFDALVTLVPPHFLIDFHASVQLKRGSHNLFKVSLDGTLEGPVPLRLSAKASFEILWISFSVHFNFTLADGDASQKQIPSVALASELAAALASPASWHTQMIPGQTHGVTLRNLPPADAFVLDPLGQLVVQQQLVPLNADRDVDTFGGAPVSGPLRFQVGATLNGRGGTPVTGAFAPARYFSMSDDDKLAAPSFENFTDGFVLGNATPLFDPAATVPAPLAYEAVVLDVPKPAAAATIKPAATTPPRYTMPLAALQAQRNTGSAARAPVRQTGRTRFRNAAAPAAATLRTTTWSIVNAATGALAPADPRLTTWSEHKAALATMNRGGAQWLMVPNHELTAA